ncbi:MAG: DUF1320 family protein [Magnetococcales bacterium]|nr:DUF1320 family protein [Magnetococcales bacterium]MBF0583073.1 DUF1320 family protein [Magnetococcales bacterium]
MPYATPTDLLLLFGATEMAGLARSDHIPPDVHVSGELMELTVSGGSRSAYTADEQTAADHCLSRMLFVLGEASLHMDSYLGSRYALPLAAGTVGANPLKTVCGDLARHALDDDSTDKATAARHADAIRWLEKVAAGQILLSTPLNPNQVTLPRCVATTPGVGFFADTKGY